MYGRTVAVKERGPSEGGQFGGKNYQERVSFLKTNILDYCTSCTQVVSEVTLWEQKFIRNKENTSRGIALVSFHFYFCVVNPTGFDVLACGIVVTDLVSSYPFFTNLQTREFKHTHNGNLPLSLTVCVCMWVSEWVNEWVCVCTDTPHTHTHTHAHKYMSYNRRNWRSNTSHTGQTEWVRYRSSKRIFFYMHICKYVKHAHTHIHTHEHTWTHHTSRRNVLCRTCSPCKHSCTDQNTLAW